MLASSKRLNRWHWFGLLVVVFSVSMPALVSGADGDKPDAAANPNHPGTKVESMARLTIQTQRGPVFKCWQEGRLIFESTGPIVDEQKLAQAITVRKSNDDAIQLLDLKQGLCVLTRHP